MAERLTKAQIRALGYVEKARDWQLNGWALGTATCEALRKRGLIEHLGGDFPFATGTRDNQSVRLTEAGRQALRGGKNA